MTRASRFRAVDALFRPKSIAIVGASDRDPDRAAIVENLLNIGFEGEIYPVNPSRDSVLGLRCYSTLADLPSAPDAVMFGLGADRVPDAVDLAARWGAKAGVVFTGGFADTGADGRVAQERLVAAAAAGGTALLGPNCQGAVSFVDRSSLYLHRIQSDYVPGRLGLISQSGSLADALIDNQQGVGWSHAASVGNESDITASDILAYLVEQETCDGVCVFLETIRDAHRFFAECDRAAELGKPVIILKTGRTANASAAAAAHTGALATSDRLVDAAFRAHRAVRVDSIEEMLSAAAIVQAGRLPRGNGIGAVVGSGGLVEMLFDGGGDVVFPEPSAGTVALLAASTGPWVPETNPLDYWPTDDLDENYPLMLHAIASDPAVDTVLEVGQFAMGPTLLPAVIGSYASALTEEAAKSDKTMIGCAPVFGEIPPPDVVRAAAEKGVALVGGVPATLAAIGALARRDITARAIWRDRTGGHVSGDLPTAEQLTTIGGLEALEIVRQGGLDVIESSVHADREAVREHARRIGYPVTVKIADPLIHHKTELGGVIVGIRDDAALRDALAILPGGELLVQATVPTPFAEIILGLTSDPELGRFVVVGMGGVWAELLDDIVVCPVGHIDGTVARDLLGRLQGFPTLAGARNRPPLAISAAVDAIVRLDALAREMPSLRAVDLNPIMLTPDRAIVVDSLVTVAHSLQGNPVGDKTSELIS